MPWRTTPRRWLSFWLGLSVLVAPATVGAAEKHCDPERPDHCVQAVKAGEEVPFAGQLLTTKKAISLGQKAVHCDERTELKVEGLQNEHRRALRGEVERREIQKTGFQERIDGLKERLAEAKKEQERPLIEHPVIVTLITTGVIGGVFALSVWAVSELDKKITIQTTSATSTALIRF